MSTMRSLRRGVARKKMERQGMVKINKKEVSRDEHGNVIDRSSKFSRNWRMMLGLEE